ncbi:MAG TPA: SMP-30/gluconolactonase/LRE family protein [Candidatus Dormibacteraeota bacterium]|nr:SMP-30/gluconolactonase/LRE family protein [Candidatus Dormibacteraeota bacterium]
MQQAELVLDAKAELAEGPCWLAERGLLVWVDITAGLVHLFDPLTGADRALEVGQPVGAAVPTDDDRLALAVRDGFALFDLDRAEVELIVEVERDLTGNRMNDGKCDPAGRFWAGTMALDMRAGTGALYRLDAERNVELMVPGVSISNGLGWSPDGRLMYYIDSPQRRVDVFDFDARSGSVANRRPFAQVKGGAPDGMAVDAGGGLWVAIWGAGKVLHFLPDATLSDEIQLPASRVTRCCFGGPELKDLYITSAWQGMTEDQRAREPLAGGIFRSRPGVQGQPTREYRTRF